MEKGRTDAEYIRDLHDRYVGREAVILGKGPSLDLRVARGYQPLPEGAIVFSMNEKVVLEVNQQ